MVFLFCVFSLAGCGVKNKNDISRVWKGDFYYEEQLFGQDLDFDAIQSIGMNSKNELVTLGVDKKKGTKLKYINLENNSILEGKDTYLGFIQGIASDYKDRVYVPMDKPIKVDPKTHLPIKVHRKILINDGKDAQVGEIDAGEIPWDFFLEKMDVDSKQNVYYIIYRDSVKKISKDGEIKRLIPGEYMS